MNNYDEWFLAVLFSFEKEKRALLSAAPRKSHSITQADNRYSTMELTYDISKRLSKAESKEHDNILNEYLGFNEPF